MRLRTALLAALAVASLTVAGPLPANAALDPVASTVNGVDTDPFDESNAVDPGNEVLDQEGEEGAPDPVPTDPATPGPGDIEDLPTKPTKPPTEFPDLPVICDRNDSWVSSWKSTKSSNVITHASGYIVPAGGSGKVTRTVEFQSQLRASITYTTEATISAKILDLGLEGKVGYSLVAEGQVTTRNSTSVETSVTRAGTHIFFMGRRKATGSFTGGRCSSNGQRISTSNGTISSYAIPYQGAVWCGENPKAGSFKAVAKKYCD